MVRKNNLLLTMGVILVALSCSINSFAQNPESRLLISVDKPANIYIDDDKVPVGRVDVGEVKIFKVMPGDHHVTAKSIDGAWSVKQVASVPPHEGRIVELKLTVPTDLQIGIVDSFTDPRDMSKYKIVTLNGKTWLAENLRFNTGSSFMYNPNSSYCYKEKLEHCLNYGRHYFLAAARTACPTGWHLPTKAEWVDLLAFYPDADIGNLRSGAKSNFNLILSGIVYRGLPVNREGSKLNQDSKLNEIGIYWADFPTRRRDDIEFATVLYLEGNNSTVREYSSRYAIGMNTTFATGASVRCVKD